MYLIALKVLEEFQSYAIDVGQVCVRMPNPNKYLKSNRGGTYQDKDQEHPVIDIPIAGNSM